MDKKVNLKILATTIVTILPIFLFIVNDFSLSKNFLYLMLPIIFAIINIFANVVVDKYEIIGILSRVTAYQFSWIIPILSISLTSIAASNAINIESPIYYIILSLIGTYICSTGVKLIEYGNEKSSFYEIPAHVRDTKDHGKKFDFISYMWILTGLVFMLLVYLRVNFFLVILVLCLAVYIAPYIIFRYMLEAKK